MVKVTKRDAYAEVASQIDALVAAYGSEDETDERRQAMIPYLEAISDELWRKARPVRVPRAPQGGRQHGE